MKKIMKIIMLVSTIIFISSFSSAAPIKISNSDTLQTLNNNGSILYVGGSGPGNYSTIQEAVDNASNGDTVFVFADSSPYYENVLVKKSIILKGEDRDTVIIDGGMKGRVISIKASDVTICGFTLQNCGNTWYHDAGVGFGTWGDPNPNHVTIKDNKIIDNYDGIYAYYGENHIFSDNILMDNRNAGIYLHSGCENSVVSGNIVSNNENFGIYCQNDDYTEIFDNTITNSWYGIFCIDSEDDKIHNNVIKDTGCGILLEYVWTSNVYRNQIEQNDEGMYCGYAPFTKIKENNFVNNDLHAIFYYPAGLFTRVYKPSWKNNYWDVHPGLMPYIIRGKKYIQFVNPFFPEGPPIEIEFSWIDIDMRPARKPHTIQ